MYVYIKSSSNKELEFCIDNDLILVKDKSIGVRIKRSDGIMLPAYEYFPRYKKTGEELVKVISESSRNTTISIPKWLYDKKISTGYRIAIGW